MGAKIYYKKDRDRMDSIVDSIAASVRAIDSMARAAVKAEEAKREPESAVNTVTVRWHDGYMETFRATEVRFGCDLLWMRLEDGNNRHIPLRSVRWFGTSIESHQSTGF